MCRSVPFYDGANLCMFICIAKFHVYVDVAFKAYYCCIDHISRETFCRYIWRLRYFIYGLCFISDECRLCDFTHGQIWLPDTANCHMFYLCEKVKVGEYRKQHMTCGDLWWKQEIHTCVRSPPEGCDVNVAVNTYVAPSTSEGEQERWSKLY